MEHNMVVKYTLITALIASSIIPFSGYFILLALVFYLIINGELKNIFSLVLKEKNIIFALLYIVLSLFRSNYKIDSLAATLGVFLVVVIYLIIRNYMYAMNDAKDIFQFFIISNIIISIYSIIQFYFFQDYHFSSSWIDSKVYHINMRAYSSLLNPNVLAGYLVFCICLNLTSLENIKARKISVFSLILSSFSLVLTYSRGAWLSFFLIVLLIYFYRRKIQYIIYFVTFFFLTLQINGNLGVERLSIHRSLHDNSMLYRLEIYKAAINIIKEHFLFGTGLNTMKYYINDYSQVINAPVYHAHNLILNILGETGFIGLIIFVMTVITLFKNLYSIYSLGNDFYKDMAVSGFLGFMSILIHGVIDATIIAPQFLFFTIYIYAFITNIKDAKNALDKSSDICSNSRKNSGGKLYGGRNVSFKKSCFRA